MNTSASIEAYELLHSLEKEIAEMLLSLIEKGVEPSEYSEAMHAYYLLRVEIEKKYIKIIN